MTTSFLLPRTKKKKKMHMHSGIVQWDRKLKRDGATAMAHPPETVLAHAFSSFLLSPLCSRELSRENPTCISIHQ
jgi:hypothetical protein